MASQWVTETRGRLHLFATFVFPAGKKGQARNGRLAAGRALPLPATKSSAGPPPAVRRQEDGLVRSASQEADVAKESGESLKQLAH